MSFTIVAAASDERVINNAPAYFEETVVSVLDPDHQYTMFTMLRSFIKHADIIPEKQKELLDLSQPLNTSGRKAKFLAAVFLYAVKQENKRTEEKEGSKNHDEETEDVNLVACEYIDMIISDWKAKTRKAHQELHWNISKDIYESAVFFVDKTGEIFFEGVPTCYCVTDILSIVSNIGAVVDDSTIVISFRNGDIITYGSFDNANVIKLENNHPDTKYCFIDKTEIIAFFKERCSEKQCLTQSLLSEEDILYAWNHCVFGSKLFLPYNKFHIDDNKCLIVNNEDTGFTLSDIRAIHYTYYTNPDDPEEYVKSIDIDLPGKKMSIYEDMFLDFNVQVY